MSNTPRNEIKNFQDIPNVGKATERDFTLLGIREPIHLVGKDPYQMYSKLCNVTCKQHDPCVIDVFIASVRYMEGGPPKKWWKFTEERKKQLDTKYCTLTKQLLPVATTNGSSVNAISGRLSVHTDMCQFSGI